MGAVLCAPSAHPTRSHHGAAGPAARPAHPRPQAKAETVRAVLEMAYADPKQVSDQLIDAILTPGLTDGATKVFLDFISYSAGPLPEEQLRILSVDEKYKNIPVWMAWGEKDPWEPIDQGRRYAEYPCVKEFKTIVGAGHCPMDEDPEQVNGMIVDFLKASL